VLQQPRGDAMRDRKNKVYRHRVRSSGRLCRRSFAGSRDPLRACKVAHTLREIFMRAKKAAARNVVAPREPKQ